MTYDHRTDLGILQVVDTIGGTGALDKSENQLSYPASKYDNLKAGF
jgi:chitinase